jgi:hypothetical protein
MGMGIENLVGDDPFYNPELNWTKKDKEKCSIKF